MSIQENIQLLYHELLCDFTDKGSCARWKEEHPFTEEPPVISVLMCIHDDVSLFNAAINSLLRQSYTRWELLILDNSESGGAAWSMIQNAMEADKRIRGYRLSQSVGWAKGTSVLLEYATGSYMTFLAADDLLLDNGLEKINQIIEQENPDIIWAGTAYAECGPWGMKLLGVTAMEQYKTYTPDNRSAALVEIMQKVFYNAMFHYERISFLKENQINFFEPFEGDCSGMTEAMAQAGRMAATNDIVHCLTMNTSQTAGTYTWDSYRNVFVNQWRSAKKIFEREAHACLPDIQYVAGRILNNFIGQLDCLCQGRCRDRYMNRVELSDIELIEQIEAALCDKDILEMFALCRQDAFGACISKLILLGDRLDWQLDLVPVGPVKKLLSIGFCENEMQSTECRFERLLDWELDSHNESFLGIHYMTLLLGQVEDSVVLRLQARIAAVIQRYTSYLDILKGGSYIQKLIYQIESAEI